jgi:hypothetical protein
LARTNRIEKQLQAALNDATREGLAIHEAKLIQVRVVALTKLFEHAQTAEKLTAEITRLTAELDRVKEENRLLSERLIAAPKPIESLESIKRAVQEYEEQKQCTNSRR